MLAAQLFFAVIQAQQFKQAASRLKKAASMADFAAAAFCLAATVIFQIVPLL